MDPSLVIALKLLAVLVLVLLNGFFVAAEFALVKIRDSQLDPLIAKGKRGAATTRKVLRGLDRYLSAAQLGITLASLALGWIGEPVFAALLEPVMHWLQINSPTLQHSIAFAVGFTSITFLHITAGEQAPKWLAIQKPLPSALFVAGPLDWFSRMAYPFIWVLNQSSLWLLKQFGIDPGGEHETAHTDEELRLHFASSPEGSQAAKLGRNIVLNALDLRHRIARDVMRPRHEIVTMNTAAPIAECLDLADKTRFSRFPLCENGDVDRTLGVVHIKDLYVHRAKAVTGRDLLSTIRKLVYVPETTRLETLLRLFLDRKLHMAIIVDEYGGTVGMVTLENILEELVGQIQDEFDQENPLITKVSDEEWLLDGALPLRDLEDLCGEKLSAGDVTTVSGWVTAQLGGFAVPQNTVAIGPHILRVEEVDGRRAVKLRLRLAPPSFPGDKVKAGEHGAGAKEGAA